MDELQTGRVLETQDDDVDNEVKQQYIEIDASTFLGTKDGMKYNLIQTSDNKFRLCEVPVDENLNTSKSRETWSPVVQDDNKNDITAMPSPPLDCKTIKAEMILPDQNTTPCKGQGDEKGYQVLSPVDYNFRREEATLTKTPLNAVENQVRLSTSPQLSYTTLVPKNSNLNLTYLTPQGAYLVKSPSFQSPITTRPMRFVKMSPRMAYVPGGSSYPGTPIPRSGTRLRRPRQTRYNRPNILHSTPIRSASSSSISSSMSFESSESMSSGSCGEGQISVEYPKVPNNTPETGDEKLLHKPKMLDFGWAPQMPSRMDFISMDPRENHNEKERKRRLRIKNACQTMRNLLPCVSDKTDNATVFEHAAHFIAFIKENIGNHDIEFTEKLNGTF